LFWSLFGYSKKKTNKKLPSPLGTAFACWAPPFPLGQTQPLPVGFYSKQIKPANRATGRKKE